MKRMTTHVLNAMKHSYSGLIRLLKEDAFRYEVFAGLMTISLFILIKVPLYKIAILLFLIFIIFALEALNTAIEEIIDFISPEYSETAKHAKDLGSFAVLCMLLASLCFTIETIVSIYQ